MPSFPTGSDATTRDIVFVDETLCNGCGACLPSCAEGALTIENGKVKIITDKLCDGLGACLGACPRGALRIEQRAAAPFDAHAARVASAHGTISVAACPGVTDGSSEAPAGTSQPSPAMVPGLENRHWPLKLQLTPPDKLFLHEARLVLAADCAPASCPNFAARYLPGRTMLITCPKLEDKNVIVEHLTELFRANPPMDITLIRMEVPCCCLPDLVGKAQNLAGTSIPCHTVTLTRYGQENLPGFGKTPPRGAHHD